MARRRERQKRNKALPKLLIVFGILFFILGSLTHAHIYYRFTLTQTERPIGFIFQAPTQLKIPSRKLEIKVDQGGIIEGEWILSETDALYLPTSGKVGEGYNTIIYAHNTDNLFGRLKYMAYGDEVFVKDNEGREFVYRVYEKEEVSATNLKELYSTEKNIITLFTCDGWFDAKRFVVRAKLSGAL